MKILVVGGAGYIGSHTVKRLALSGHSPVVVDDRRCGNADVSRYAPSFAVDTGNTAAIAKLLSEQRCEAVMHFASNIDVAESMRDPAMYYANNLCATVSLLQAMRETGVLRMVFSSTAAIFGNSARIPIDESQPAAPVNPYGRSKWMVEQILEDFARAYGMRRACLRYFNAAGADPEGEFGECHEPETHLIPLILRAASGRREDIVVYGRDHATRDGTCERDYIHVNDLADAHLAALAYLDAGGEQSAFNLGTGQGYTVAEVIDNAQRLCARTVKVRDAMARPGDPPRLVADPTLAMRTLGWTPHSSSIENILRDAWHWETRSAASAAAAGC